MQTSKEKEIAKPSSLILLMYIIRGIRIKRVEEINGEISKVYEQFTGKICMTLKHMKRCSVLLIIMETQI